MALQGTRDQVWQRDTERRWPPQFIVGLVLIAATWPLSWVGPLPLSGYTFFPLWLGYILTVDGLALLRGGTSLLTRNAGRFALLFAFSIPVWWVFEFANEFLGNWRYVQATEYNPVAYAVLASIAFSTVMPAVFVTAELYRTFGVFKRPRRWIRIAPSRGGLIAIAALGLGMFVASLVFPDVAYPLVWIGLYLLLDVVNTLTGAKSGAEQVADRRWDTVLVLFAAGITCGFFWEMWNYWSLPKWVYEVPHVPDIKLFEMPIPGYGGYFPFALEIYASYHVLHTLIFRRRDTYLTFDDPAQHPSPADTKVRRRHE